MFGLERKILAKGTVFQSNFLYMYMVRCLKIALLVRVGKNEGSVRGCSHRLRDMEQ